MNENKKQVTGAGVVSLIFGIIGLIVFPFFMGAVAIIFGLASAKEDGLGVAGIIIGIIEILFAGMMLLSQS